MNSIDTVNHVISNYIHLANQSNNYNLPAANQTIDLFNPNNQLLRAALFCKINQFRKTKNKQPLKPEIYLQSICESYVNKYYYSKFNANGANYYKVKNILKKVPKHINLHYKLYDGYVHLASTTNYTRGSFYYDKEADTDLKLFIGNKFTEEPVPIEAITYNELAERITKKWSNSRGGIILKSDVYEYLAVAIIIEKRTLNKTHKTPKAKAIFLVGGFRNNLILKDEKSRARN